ncbi:MAG: hypothetical protein M3R38_38115, partial [Actinomycetota bacterium]|nr:hypothetical protein [Actinomycetota bacterium]
IERRFENDADRKIHALTLNLARRQLGPVSWAYAFKALLDARGFKLGQGANNQHTVSGTVADALDELPREKVHERTARRRLKLAEKLEPYPETAEKVDRGEIKVKDALEAAAREAAEKGIEPPPLPPKQLPEGYPGDTRWRGVSPATGPLPGRFDPFKPLQGAPLPPTPSGAFQAVTGRPRRPHGGPGLPPHPRDRHGTEIEPNRTGPDATARCPPETTFA